VECGFCEHSLDPESLDNVEYLDLFRPLSKHEAREALDELGAIA
jgi:hypothetical protein